MHAKHTSIAVALACSGALVAPAFAGEAEMQQQIEQLSKQLNQLQTQLDEVKNRQPTEAAPSNVSLFGYGELSYQRPRRDSANTQATAGRAVLGVSYRFNDRTRMVSELEVENAVASSGDQGEVAIEQMYIEHRLSDQVHAKLGLFLIPTGLLNETHEPNNYYGVFRNSVETAIIPTTWREIGAGLQGTLDNGLRWDAGITTGFDLNKWDAASDEGRESPLGSIHQEGQLARAKSLSGYAALNFNGVPGLNVGASAFTGGVGQGVPDFAARDARLTLWEVHSRWQPGKFDLSALYAKGRISKTADLNQTFAGQPTPVPQEFYGWYAQAAYKLWTSGDYSLAPFVRYERLNTAQSYAAMPAGLEVDTQPDERIRAAGLSFKLHPQVVIKADYRQFKQDKNKDGYNLGVGYSF